MKALFKTKKLPPETAFNYEPFIRATWLNDGALLIACDDRCHNNTLRSSRLVTVPMTGDSLSSITYDVQLAEPVLHGDVATYTGSVDLIVKDQRIPLAPLSLRLLGNKQESGQMAFKECASVANVIQQGVAASLMRAFVQLQAPAAKPLTQPISGKSAAIHEADSSHRNSGSYTPWVISAGLITLLIVAYFFGAPRTEDGAITSTVNDAMFQDPALIEAQVEMTRNALKQMGIDPGSAADVGCLAPQE